MYVCNVCNVMKCNVMKCMHLYPYSCRYVILFAIGSKGAEGSCDLKCHAFFLSHPKSIGRESK